MGKHYWDGSIEVCEDCYFAHHYGVRVINGAYYSGDSFIAAYCKPLSRCDGLELADNTDAETGFGLTTFSGWPCEGCDSHLAGKRFQLVYRAYVRV